MKFIIEASLKNLSDRLVELELLPSNAGDIKLSSLPDNLANVIRKVGQGWLLIVSNEQVPFSGVRILRLEIRNKEKIEATYVLPRNNQ